VTAPGRRAAVFGGWWVAAGAVLALAAALNAADPTATASLGALAGATGSAAAVLLVLGYREGPDMGAVNVHYADADRELARREGRPLVTIDMDCSHVGSGPLAGTNRVTLQGCLSEEQAAALFALVRELTRSLPPAAVQADRTGTRPGQS
jgi:hypothetical protein